MKRTKTIALASVLLSVMMVLGYLESLIPVSTVPGIKLGLSNSMLILSLFWLGIPLSFTIMVLKTVLLGILMGNPMLIPYSLAGGVLSLITMSLLCRMKGISPIGIGISGGVMHNVGQVTMAIVILQTPSLVYYLGLLIPVGAGMGFLTGSVSSILRKHLKFIYPMKQEPNDKSAEKTLS